MVIRPGWWKALRLLEDGGMGRSASAAATAAVGRGAPRLGAARHTTGPVTL
jgi:hypothetical protein